MNAVLTQIADYLWNQSWQIMLLTGVVAAITWLLRGRSAHLRYLLWLLVLAKCLVPPAFNVALPVLSPVLQISTAAPYEPFSPGPVVHTRPDATIAALPDLEGPADGATPAASTMANVSMREGMVLLWLAGTALLLTMAMVKAARTGRWLQRRRRELSGRLQADIDALFDSFAVRWRPRAWLIEDVGQPFVWGLVRGDIHLPISFVTIGDAEHRRNILAHEVSHVLRFDAAVNLLQVLAQAVFWFHPLVWWANRRIRAEREESCDEMVIARLGARPRDYSRAIVETLLNEHRSLRPVPSLAVAGPVKNIEERIKTMLRPGKRFYRRPSLLAAACALLLALLIVPTTLALTNRAADAQAKETETEVKGKQIQTQRLLSAGRLKQIGLSLHLYAIDHEEKYPEELMALMPYFSRDRADELATFMSNDAEYLAAGKAQPQNRAWDVPLAYDLTLLRNDEGTNVVFADGHVQFIKGEQLDKYGIRLPQSHLEVLEVRFEPIHQGKNVVHVTVGNTSNKEQVFTTHIYTRSPDYGEGGVGWGTPFSDIIKPQEKKPVRFVFKIQGPVTDRTYVNLHFFNPQTQESYDHKRYFERRQYTSAELPKALPEQAARKPASPAETQAVAQAFNQIQGYIRDRRYEQAWGRFSKDFQEAEYQKSGLETFRRAMEPTHPMHSAFTWEREEFLNLRPGQVFAVDGKLVLSALTDGQTWTIDFVRADNQWKMDWIAGYVPAIIRMQEQQRTPATGSANMTAEDKPPASGDKTADLKVLDIQFDPIRQGKNAVHIEIQNTAQTEQTLGIDIRTEFPFQNWQRQLSRPVPGHTTKRLTFEFEIPGPIVDDSSVRLRFYHLPSTAAFDIHNWFAERRYTIQDLPLHDDARGPTAPVSQAEKDAITKAFLEFRQSVKEQDYPTAWGLLSEHFRSLFENDIGKFRERMGSDEARSMFGSLRPDSVTRLGTFLTLRAKGESLAMKLHFIEEDGQWKMYQGEMDRDNWEDRLLPTMEKRTAAHFDIYYFKDSTATREIDRIAKQKDDGFAQICRFLGKDSDIRIRLVLFEDGRTKQQATGHQGTGWAYGNTIVEVYNEKERLDPYHETTHILMGPFGKPPALFNEGFAVYMSERLGAPALENLSGGQAAIHQRARELKDKGEWIELPELLGYTEIGSKATRPPVAYPEAGSFVKFLIDTCGKDTFLQAYRTLRNSNDEAVRQDNIKKLEEICGTSLHTLQQQWETALTRS